MGVRFPGTGNNTIVNANVVTTAETIVAMVGPISQSIDSQLVMLFWFLDVLQGASTTSRSIRLRRGNSLAGTQLNVTSTDVAGAGVIQTGGCYVDFGAGNSGPLFYVLTFQVASATGNSTVNDVSLIALML